MVRKTIRAWISWAVDTDKLDSQGAPIKTGLTYELANKMVRDLSLLHPAGGTGPNNPCFVV